MKTQFAKISEIIMLNNEPCLRMECPGLAYVQPGQFLQAYAVEERDLLPTLLFPCSSTQNASLFNRSIPRDWMPGTELHLRGPRGNGFHLPPLARRVALTTMDQTSVNRLLPLAGQALINGAEVTLLTDHIFSQLAPEIEVLPLNEIAKIKNWADYIATIIKPNRLAAFTQSLEFTPGKANPIVVEVMLDAAMLCDESSACGVCAVFTSRGWKLACKDGPVFSLDELITEEFIHG